jgi:arsenical pump membrane protein
VDLKCSFSLSEGSAISQHVAIWVICAASIAGILVRPRGIPEWVFAVAGAGLLALAGLVPLAQIGRAVAKGTDVYFFLGGMMLLAEIARREGVFDWAASHAVRTAKGSRVRLFAIVYVVGVLVTVVLSNDATAVVLTPAVAAAIRKAKAEPLPYVLACAFVANAASFVLPVSNPANLVVFAGAVPPLPHWIASFAVPSLLAIVATATVLALVSRSGLRGAMQSDVDVSPLGRSGALVVAGIVLTAIALVTASTFDAPLGVTTLACGAIVFVLAAIRDRASFAPVLRAVSWPVLLLVAGLFVLVQGLDVTGALEVTRRLAETAPALPSTLANLGAAAVTAGASNLINNLPAGLIAGSAVASLHNHDAFRSAVAIGIDLGPNLSVTGSLATVLWLVALRREEIEVTAWTFLRAGVFVMPPALVLAVLGLSLTAR